MGNLKKLLTRLKTQCAVESYGSDLICLPKRPLGTRYGVLRSTLILNRFKNNYLWREMAERQGFEPWEGYKPSTVFKTVAFDHSATSPSRMRILLNHQEKYQPLRQLILDFFANLSREAIPP